MRSLKIAVIGSGSTYTPELIKGFIDRKELLNIGSLYLCDIDCQKNEIVSGLLRRMLYSAGLRPEIVLTSSVEDSVKSADYVITQMRVGLMEARILDEKIPLKYGLLGQETTGIGGLINALRTVPVALSIASKIERLAPNAWLINFANPSGLVAEAILNRTKVKAAGVCNVPYRMIKEARSFVEGKGNFDYDFVGLNHLCWLNGAYIDGKDVLPYVLNMPLEKSGLSNIPDMKYEPEFLKTIGAIPCGYLNYYYFREEAIKKCMEADKTRGEICRSLEEELLELYKDENLKEKPEILDKRGGAFYSEAAVSLIEAIENDRNDIQVVNVKNNGVFPFLQPSDVVETRCRITRGGIIPLSPKKKPQQHMIGLMQAVKSYEKLAIEAAVTGSFEKAMEALLVHPLIGDYYQAKSALKEMLNANRDFLPQFDGYFKKKGD